jgi:hypothetical protein
MPSGVYKRTPAHIENMRIAQIKIIQRRAESNGKSNGLAQSARQQTADALNDFASEQLGEAIKSNDFQLAHAWLDLRESLATDSFIRSTSRD